VIGQQLKNSILQMAVQGKLVPQDPNDEPASVLLERIREEKAVMIKAGKIKKEKNPSVIFRGADNLPYEKVGNQEPVCIADEVPFEIPDSWEWVRLCSLVSKEIKRGKSPKYSAQKGVQVFAQKCNAKSGVIDMTLAKTLDPAVFGKYSQEEYLRDQDIIINSTGNGTLGRIGVFQDANRIDDSVIVPDSHVTVVRPLSSVNKAYLLYVLKYYQPYLEKQGEGSTNQTELKPIVISNLFIPIPPAEEQKGIAKKLADVFPIIDNYGNKEEALTIYNKTFPDQLKKSILQLAVQGKLVPQDPNDEPASVLLERIRAEKEKLIAKGKIKRDKHESDIYKRDNSHYEKLDGIERCIDDEIPFEIPEGWKWARLYSLTSKEIKRGKSPKYSIQRGIQVFAQKCNAKSGGIDLTLAKYLDPSVFGKYPQEEYLQDQDVIINSTGNGTLGRVGIFQDADRIDNSVIVPDSHVTTVRLLSRLNRGYLLYVLKYYQPYLEKQGTGSTNQTELRPSIIAELLIPVPPEAEQDRILRKIDATLPSLNEL